MPQPYEPQRILTVGELIEELSLLPLHCHVTFYSREYGLLGLTDIDYVQEHGDIEFVELFFNEPDEEPDWIITDRWEAETDTEKTNEEEPKNYKGIQQTNCQEQPTSSQSTSSKLSSTSIMPPQPYVVRGLK
jgi:hypothetical protein